MPKTDPVTLAELEDLLDRIHRAQHSRKCPDQVLYNVYRLENELMGLIWCCQKNGIRQFPKSEESHNEKSVPEVPSQEAAPAPEDVPGVGPAQSDGVHPGL